MHFKDSSMLYILTDNCYYTLKSFYVSVADKNTMWSSCKYTKANNFASKLLPGGKLALVDSTVVSIDFSSTLAAAV